MKIDVVRARELTGRDRASWSRLQADLGPDYASPILSPGWACAVDAAQARFGGETQVAVLRDEAGAAVGFLPVKRIGDTAMPAGAPLCDYQGLVAQAGIEVDPREIIKVLGVARFDFCFLLLVVLFFGVCGLGGVLSFV